MTQVFAAVTKNPNSVLDYVVDWTLFLATSETIATSSWTADTGITLDSDSETTTTTTVFVSGGTLNTVYNLVNTITTNQGRTDTRTVQVTVAFMSAIGRVRMLAGDADTTDELLADNHYAWALAQASDGLFGAASIICKAIAAKFSRLVDTTVEGLSVSYSQRVEHYNEMAAKFEAQASRLGETIGGELIGNVVAGGTSVSTADGVRDNSDRVTPAFERGMFKIDVTTDVSPD